MMHRVLGAVELLFLVGSGLIELDRIRFTKLAPQRTDRAVILSRILWKALNELLGVFFIPRTFMGGHKGFSLPFRVFETINTTP